jgi:hypothetical protein
VVCALEPGRRNGADVSVVVERESGPDRRLTAVRRYFPVVAVVMFWPYVVTPVMNFFEGV